MVIISFQVLNDNLDLYTKQIKNYLKWTLSKQRKYEKITDK